MSELSAADRLRAFIDSPQNTIAFGYDTQASLMMALDEMVTHLRALAAPEPDWDHGDPHGWQAWNDARLAALQFVKGLDT